MIAYKVDCCGVCRWCHERDLNSRPPAYETKQSNYLFSVITVVIESSNIVKSLYLKALSALSINQKNKIVVSLLLFSASFYIQNTYKYCKLYCKLFLSSFYTNQTQIKLPMQNNNFLILVFFIVYFITFRHSL